MDDAPAYSPTPRTRATRNRDRIRYDAPTVHAVLDEGRLCHLGFVADGAPVVLPTLYARVGGVLYLHGSTGAAAMRMARGGGLEVCATVTLTDGLVLARSGMHHSINYRSVVVRGTAYRVSDEAEQRSALDAIVDAVVPGRSADCRPADAKELAQTAVLRLELREVSAKVRTGGVNDEPEDVDLPHWAGVVPVTEVYGAPEPDAAMAPGAPLPEYLRTLTGSPD
ncbi:pyridoxamine 5'-phosphate oxidase family protein [Nocardiopsis suaedae]|uniref:Pyridoxamine 5'-phosphate oxidase family protein n=1 Tax=Nocardiopsis suaedae TaxID=3018444 RepID=A0ABT4TKU5_9ACTN|nr:pyridoxamine 5'-phosphate oxidase family protein [Nocardiopsis suaedae]MDA2805010.1 pyridoxamine 5'-phosphate oxidase family protein [Nocardiopsis suaedae]